MYQLPSGWVGSRQPYCYVPGGHIEYVRGLDAAYDKVRDAADVAFLLEPTTIEQVANVAFSGGVMPQKSTDFYPKLLSGLTIYKLQH